MKIQIVKNSDRCHVSIDGIPAATFLFSNYENDNGENKIHHALNDAKITAFNELHKLNKLNLRAFLDTNIITK